MEDGQTQERGGRSNTSTRKEDGQTQERSPWEGQTQEVAKLRYTLHNVISLTTAIRAKARNLNSGCIIIIIFFFFSCSCESSSLHVGYFCGICNKKYRKNDSDNWIGCDGECNRWFHYKCVGVTDVPQEDWFCPDCCWWNFITSYVILLPFTFHYHKPFHTYWSSVINNACSFLSHDEPWSQIRSLKLVATWLLCEPSIMPSHASFPGCSRLKFLIACSMQWGGSLVLRHSPSVFAYCEGYIINDKTIINWQIGETWHFNWLTNIV